MSISGKRSDHILKYIANRQEKIRPYFKVYCEQAGKDESITLLKVIKK